MPEIAKTPVSIQIKLPLKLPKFTNEKLHIDGATVEVSEDRVRYSADSFESRNKLLRQRERSGLNIGRTKEVEDFLLRIDVAPLEEDYVRRLRASRS